MVGVIIEVFSQEINMSNIEKGNTGKGSFKIHTLHIHHNIPLQRSTEDRH
jgi:hypothetical protein